MPIIKSAKKRVRVNNKAAVRNSKTKRALKTSFKLFAKTPSADSHSSAQSNIDKMLKKGIIHKNKAARMKKRLAAEAKTANVKTGTKKATAKAAPAKKTAAKRSPVATKSAAGKPAAKKAPAKKPATKK